MRNSDWSSDVCSSDLGLTICVIGYSSAGNTCVINMSQPVGLERGNGRIERTARLRLVQFNHARIECERWQHIVERCRTNAARHCLGSYNGEIVLKSGLVLRHSG